MDDDTDFFAIIAKLHKKYRQISIMLALLAFILGMIAGGVLTYCSIDRVTIISTAPQIRV